MLNSVEIRNFGPLTRLDWDNLGPINLIIGGNDSGKTFLLKALYCVMRTVEDYKRGKEPRSAADILAERLYWTFQSDKIGDLVSKNGDEDLFCSVSFEGKEFSFHFDKDTTGKIADLENRVPPRSSNSIFLPAKEVLSLHNIILQSRQKDRVFGFDDTYYDLATALQIPAGRGRDFTEFADSRKELISMFGGRIRYDEASKEWIFKKGNQRFTMGVTAEGIKKIGILDTLLGNGYLDTKSIVFMDAPDSALHPEAVSKLMEIIALLAKRGIQFFLASHSLFVIKKLFIIAQREKMSIPLISSSKPRLASASPENSVHEKPADYAVGDESPPTESPWSSMDLLNDFPDNPIDDESVELYKEEMVLTFK